MPALIVRPAGVCAVAGQGQRAGADLGDEASAADQTGIGQRIAAVEDQRSVVDDVAGDTAGRAAIAEPKRAGADRRGAGVGVVPRQGQRVGAVLGDGAGAADQTGIGQRVAAVEDERGIVDDVAGDAAGRAATAERQRAGADRRGAGVGVVAGQGQCAGAALGDGAGPADQTGIGQRIAAVEDQRGIVDDVAGYAARGAATAERKRAGADRRDAGVGVVAGQRQCAGAGLRQSRRAGQRRGDRSDAPCQNVDRRGAPSQGESSGRDRVASRRE